MRSGGAAEEHQRGTTREDVLDLLREHGGVPRAYFGTLPGMRWFEHAGAVVAYRTVEGVAIALDAPIGSPEAAAVALAQFAVRAARSGTLAACYKLPATYIPLLTDLGWRGVKFGEEALLDPREFHPGPDRRRALRSPLRRLAAHGYRVEAYDLAADPRGWSARLGDISAAWLADKFGGEMDFAVGTLEQAVRFAAEQRCFVLLDGVGDPRAFVTLVPTFGAPPGWALDLLRRADNLPGGAMDFLLLETLRKLGAEGCELLSLGLAPLADFSGAEWPGGGLRRARRLLFSRFNQVYNFAGLAAFKAKYRPRWEPRFLAYPSSSALPQVLWALYRAHFPAQGRGADDATSSHR